MMKAAARYALDPDNHPPPPELTLTFQSMRWGDLPDTGGLRDQEAGLLDKMEASYNVYRAFKGVIGTKDIAKWSQANPGLWKLYWRVKDMLAKDNADAKT